MEYLIEKFSIHLNKKVIQPKEESIQIKFHFGNARYDFLVPTNTRENTLPKPSNENKKKKEKPIRANGTSISRADENDDHPKTRSIDEV